MHLVCAKFITRPIFCIDQGLVLEVYIKYCMHVHLVHFILFTRGMNEVMS